MHELIEQALTRFETLCDTWGRGYGTLKKHSSYVYLWTPPINMPTITAPKPIGLTLQAITHGNEVGGILALLECLRLLHGGTIRPQITLAFILGNPAGARANRRFIESDLNRAFGSAIETLEGQRARQLESVLSETAYFLDFHQTIEKSVQPFFIFPYTAAGLAFARAAHGDVAVVTHWGKSFSLDGMCTDEFVNYKGGTGITIELGAKGFDPYHTSVGLQAAMGAIQYVQEILTAQYQPAEPRSPLYTWKAIEVYEDGMELNEGLYNFQDVKKGEVIGMHQGSPLECRASGLLLFPKYPRDPLAPRAKELYRVAKRIEVHELGQPGVVGV